MKLGMDRGRGILTCLYPAFGLLLGSLFSNGRYPGYSDRGSPSPLSGLLFTICAGDFFLAFAVLSSLAR